MSRPDDLPHSVWQDEIHIDGLRLRCHVLSNGQRVFDADDMSDLFHRLANGPEFPHVDWEKFTRFVNGIGD